MNHRQLTVCAIALFADGYSRDQIAEALNLESEEAQKFIEAGANAQAAGEMGFMDQHMQPWSRAAEDSEIT